MNYRTLLILIITSALVPGTAHAILGRITSLTMEPVRCDVYFLGFLNDYYLTHDRANCNCNFAIVQHNFKYCTDVKAYDLVKGHELPPVKEREKERERERK